MKILRELDPIHLSLKRLSLGEIIRGTRDLLGLKQWKLASLLGLNIAQMKMYESNRYGRDPKIEIIENFCELFGYNFQDVWNQATSHVQQYKKSMEIFGKHPHYARRLDQMGKQQKKVPAITEIEKIQLKPKEGLKCSFSYSENQ